MPAKRIIFGQRNLGEFLACERTLQVLLAFCALVWPDGEDLVIGDIHRTDEENVAAEAKTPIHVVGPPFRAIDVRVTQLPGDPQANADAIGAKIRDRYVYDPDRPTMVVAYTQPHGNGPHVHLQSHQNTRLRTTLDV